MFPNIIIGDNSIPTFSVCVAVGMCVFIFSVMIKAHRADRTDREIFFILPKIGIAFLFGYAGAIFFESFFEIPVNGGFKYVGIMFYGGALSGMAAVYFLVKLRETRTRFTASEWMSKMAAPFAAFHCIGRIGCFLAGCCYGRETDGVFGVMFPDRPEAGIYHHGQAVYPVQLFEAIGLLLIVIAVHFYRRDKFAFYMILYAVLRFALEFLRGDKRGGDIFGLSPSQITAFSVVYFIYLSRLIKRLYAAISHGAVKLRAPRSLL